MTVPLWAWGATFGVLAVLIAADLMLTRSAAGLRAAALEVPAQLQRRVLHFGVLGALVLRGAAIVAGGALIGQVSWIRYVFGGLVLLAGARMFRPPKAAGQRTYRTVRALDSIPAVFGVTRDLFVVFTSNAFAVLGLRALYVLLAGAVDRFRYLRQGIALLLVFIGGKMLLSPVVELPVTVSLGAIVVVAAGAIAASRWRDRSRPRHEGPQHEGPRESPRKAAVGG